MLPQKKYRQPTNDSASSSDDERDAKRQRGIGSSSSSSSSDHLSTSTNEALPNTAEDSTSSLENAAGKRIQSPVSNDTPPAKRHHGPINNDNPVATTMPISDASLADTSTAQTSSLLDQYRPLTFTPGMSRAAWVTSWHQRNTYQKLRLFSGLIRSMRVLDMHYDYDPIEIYDGFVQYIFDVHAETPTPILDSLLNLPIASKADLAALIQSPSFNIFVRTHFHCSDRYPDTLFIYNFCYFFRMILQFNPDITILLNAFFQKICTYPFFTSTSAAILTNHRLTCLRRNDFLYLNHEALAADNFYLPFHLLAAFGITEHNKSLHSLLTLKILELADNDGNTPLHIATRYGHEDVVANMLALKPSLEHKNSKGDTALIMATRTSVNIVKMLLNAGASVDAANNRKITPLMFAASAGKVQCLRLLLAKGANVDATNDEGKTPLIFAAEEGKFACLRELIVHGATVDAVDSRERTALWHAVAFGKPAPVLVLLLAGANLNFTNNHGVNLIIQCMNWVGMKILVPLLLRFSLVSSQPDVPKVLDCPAFALDFIYRSFTKELIENTFYLGKPWATRLLIKIANQYGPHVLDAWLEDLMQQNPDSAKAIQSHVAALKPRYPNNTAQTEHQGGLTPQATTAALDNARPSQTQQTVFYHVPGTTAARVPSSSSMAMPPQ